MALMIDEQNIFFASYSDLILYRIESETGSAPSSRHTCDEAGRSTGRIKPWITPARFSCSERRLGLCRTWRHPRISLAYNVSGASSIYT